MNWRGWFGQRSMAFGTALVKVSPSRQNPFVLLVLGCAVLVFALAYLARVSYAGSDPQPSLLVSQAILDQGTIRLDAYMGLNSLDLRQWTVENANGHSYYYWPIGPSVFSLPLVWALNLLGLDMAILRHNNRAQNLMSASLCALTFVLLYRLCRKYLARWPSLLIATISMLGTGLISTLGTALWNINFAVLLIVLLLLQLARIDRQGTKAANPYWIGFLLFSAFFSRPSTSTFILVVLAYLLFKDRGLFLKTAATSLGLLVVYVAFSWLEYGHPFQEYYNIVRVGIYSFPLWTVLYGHFLSPSRGLLIFSPFLALVLGGMLWRFRDIRKNPLLWLAMAWFVLHIALVSRSTRWWGGHSFGPRILTEVIPALVLITVLLWRHVAQGLSQRVQRAAIAIYVLLGLVAVFINSYQGLYNVSTQLWNGYSFAPNIDKYPEYLLDWRYPQFLATNRALCARNQEHMLGELARGAFDLDIYQPGEGITYVSGFDEVPPGDSGPAQVARGIQGQGAEPQLREHLLLLPVVFFSRANAVFVGWSKAGNGYRWSECPEPRILFELGELDTTDQRYEIEIASGSLGTQRASVFLNGVRIGDVVFPGPRATAAVRRIAFEGTLLKPNDLNEIRFSLPDARSPSQRDPRLLGLAFSALHIDTIGGTER